MSRKLPQNLNRCVRASLATELKKLLDGVALFEAEDKPDENLPAYALLRFKVSTREGTKGFWILSVFVAIDINTILTDDNIYLHDDLLNRVETLFRAVCVTDTENTPISYLRLNGPLAQVPLGRVEKSNRKRSVLTGEFVGTFSATT